MNMDGWPVALATAGLTEVGWGEKVVSSAVINDSPGRTGTYEDCGTYKHMTKNQ